MRHDAITTDGDGFDSAAAWSPGPAEPCHKSAVERIHTACICLMRRREGASERGTSGVLELALKLPFPRIRRRV